MSFSVREETYRKLIQHRSSKKRYYNPDNLKSNPIESGEQVAVFTDCRTLDEVIRRNDVREAHNKKKRATLNPHTSFHAFSPRATISVICEANLAEQYGNWQPKAAFSDTAPHD